MQMITQKGVMCHQVNPWGTAQARQAEVRSMYMYVQFRRPLSIESSIHAPSGVWRAI